MAAVQDELPVMKTLLGARLLWSIYSSCFQQRAPRAQTSKKTEKHLKAPGACKSLVLLSRACMPWPAVSPFVSVLSNDIQC